MEEPIVDNSTEEKNIITKKELKQGERLYTRAIKHLRIVVRYQKSDIIRLTELHNIINDYPLVLEKFNEIAQKQNDLIDEFRETGNRKYLKDVKRLSKTIPSFDDTNKENDKNLKNIFKRFVKLDKDVKKHKGIIEYHTRMYEELIASNPRIEEFLKDRTESYNEIFDMD